MTPYAWAMHQPPGAAFRRPDGAVVRLPAAPRDAPVCPSPDHVWAEDQETDAGAWVPAAEVRTWERV